LGKIHDHTEKDHPELLSDLPINGIAEYRRRYRRLLKEDFFEIQGPSRLTDAQVINTFHGRMPNLGLNVADNQREK
jgi:hypothetical protein